MQRYHTNRSHAAAIFDMFRSFKKHRSCKSLQMCIVRGWLKKWWQVAVCFSSSHPPLITMHFVCIFYNFRLTRKKEINVAPQNRNTPSWNLKNRWRRYLWGIGARASPQVLNKKIIGTYRPLALYSPVDLINAMYNSAFKFQILMHSNCRN